MKIHLDIAEFHGIKGFVIEQVLRTQSHYGAFFWATHQGAEIDLILSRGSALYGVECKPHGHTAHDAFGPHRP